MVVMVTAVGCGGASDAPLGDAGIGAARSNPTLQPAALPDDESPSTAGDSSVADATTVPGAATDTAADTAPTVADTGATAATTDTGPTVPPVTARPGPARSVSLGFVGDVLAHSPLWRGAAANAGGTGFDFRPMFAAIAPVIERSDHAVCHLETPIAPEGEDYSTDPLYGVPAEIVEAVAWAGFDRCSTAGNHVLDRGVAGIDRTLDVLDANGVAHAGTARTADEIEPTVFTVGDVDLAHLAYTYGTNGIPVPSAEPWRTRLIDPTQILADARLARERGSEFTIVSLHWGTEKQHDPTAEQRAIAEQLTDSGLVDLIVGHHAHVVQPIEQVNGVWVAYGLGDILSNLPAADHWPAASQDGIVVEFDVTVGAGEPPRVGTPRVTPIWVDKDSGWVVRDVVSDLADASLPDWRRNVLEASLARTSEVVGAFVG